MKNRILSLLLVVVFAVSLCACGGNNSANSNNGDTQKKETEQSINSEYEFDKARKLYVLSVEQAKEFITRIEITTENWEEYFGTWEDTVEIKNAFGEVTGSKKERYYGIKRELLGSYAIDNVLLLFDKYAYYVDGNYYEEKTDAIDFNDGLLQMEGNKICNNKIFFDFECVKAKGNVFKIDIPDELWMEPNYVDGYEGKAILITVPNGEKYFLYQTKINDIQSQYIYDELYEIEQ